MRISSQTLHSSFSAESNLSVHMACDGGHSPKLRATLSCLNQPSEVVNQTIISAVNHGIGGELTFRHASGIPEPKHRICN